MMNEYNCKQIVCFDKNGITFSDGTVIRFDECRANWANSKGISIEDTTCVAERDISGKKPYFLFYTDNRIRIVFKKGFFPWSKEYKKEFTDIQMGLIRFGYSSYDCS